MIKQVVDFENCLTKYFEVDDLLATELIIAAAVTHKVSLSEMLWVRIIGASGSGKTEFLRTLMNQDCSVTMENITAASIRRGYIAKNKEESLLERINNKLVITKEFASMLTKDLDSQKAIFGLLRSVYDGSLDCDFNSETSYIHQEVKFDWILGSTSYIDKIRNIEYLLGSRFVDIRWESPTDRKKAVIKAVANNIGSLDGIRCELSQLMAEILDKINITTCPTLDYISDYADITSKLRTPVERDSRTKELEDLPEVELGTRMGQALSRFALGLSMIGVEDKNIKPYLTRVVMNSMSRLREAIVKSMLIGNIRQNDIAKDTGLSQGLVSRTMEDMRLVGFKDGWLELLSNNRG